MALYNLTSIAAGNRTSLLTFTQGVNEILMNNLLGTFFLISISLVIFISFMFTTNDFKRSMLATSFISFSLSLILLSLDLVSPLVLYITLILTAVIAAVTWKN